MRRVMAVLLMFALVLTLAACGAKSVGTEEPTGIVTAATKNETSKVPTGETITFALPSQWANKAAMQQLVDKYFKETGNTVEISALDDKSYMNLYLAKLAGGDFYDVIYGKTGPGVAALNIEENFVDFTNEDWVKEIDQSILESFLLNNNKVYGAPLGGTNVIGIVYNKTIFAELGLEIPKTETEFVNVCEKIKAAGKTPIYLAGKDIWPLVQFANAEWPAIEAANPGIVAKFNENKASFANTKEALDFATKMQNYSKMGFYNTDCLTATYDMLLKEFAENNAAMIFMGDWIAADLNTKFPGTDFGMFARPTDSGEVYISSTAPDVMYVYKNSDKVDVAIDFIRFWQKSENRDIWFADNANMPVYQGQQVENLNVIAKDAQQYFKTGNVRGHWHNRMSVINTDDFFRNYQLLVSGDITPLDFLTKMDENFAMVGRDLKIPGFEG